jgi:hypothetical protein
MIVFDICQKDLTLVMFFLASFIYDGYNVLQLIFLFIIISNALFFCSKTCMSDFCIIPARSEFYQT